MIAFLTSWKTWLAAALAATPFLVPLLPITAPVFVAFLQSKAFRSITLGLLIAAGVLLLISAIEARAYNRGVADKTEQIGRQNEQAVRRANEAAIPVEDCHDRGGDWIQERGVCALP